MARAIPASPCASATIKPTGLPWRHCPTVVISSELTQQPAPAAPSILSVPLRTVAKVGTSLTLTVEPGGDGPFQCSWRRNEGPGSTNFFDIPGATNASLSLSDLQVSDSGQLQVAVVNPGGAVYSPHLTLLVEPDPALPGSVDGSFGTITPVGLLTSLYQLTAPNPDGSVYAVVNGSLVRVYEDGSRDLRFHTPPDLVPAGSGNGISAICRQADGNLLVAGRLGTTAIVRLLPDGSYDPSFVRTNQFTGGAQELPISLGVQSTGQILVAGTFGNFDGRPVTGLVRLHADGRFDDSFSIPMAWSFPGQQASNCSRHRL